MKGRFIGENIRTIDDVMRYTLKEKTSGIALCIDLKKAFYTKEVCLSGKALQKVAFGSDLISWFNTFYSTFPTVLRPCHTIAYRTCVCQRMKNITHTLVYADNR